MAPPPRHAHRAPAHRHLPTPFDGWPLRDHLDHRIVRVKKLTTLVHGEPFLRAGPDAAMVAVSLLSNHENEITARAIFDDLHASSPRRGAPAQLDTEAWKELRQAFERGTYVLVAIHPRPGSVPWEAIPEDDRIVYVIDLLTEKYHYPVNGAAGVVGNLIAESTVLPDMVEGGTRLNGMRAFPFKPAPPPGTKETDPTDYSQRVDFSPTDIIQRSKRNRTGPGKPGMGIAQWTDDRRRGGLPHMKRDGRELGASVLSDMDAQVEYLVKELRVWKGGSVNKVLTAPGVSVDAACDEIVYRYEVPGSVCKMEVVNGKKKLTLRPIDDQSVQATFAVRRKYAHQALDAYGVDQAEKHRAHPSH